MKKILIFIQVLVLLSAILIFPTRAYASTQAQHRRAIHVVYDDSGSMYRSGGVYNDRWGQAHYAMEVFAAMLSAADTMRVYYMSDFVPAAGGDINAPPRLTIYGAEPVSARVSQIRNTITRTSSTPFDPVIRAYYDLLETDADEKWLVVLTDGVFNVLRGLPNEYIDVNGYLTQFASQSDVNIILLAVGDDPGLLRMLATLIPDPSINYYFYHAQNSTDILENITYISNRIFNRNILPFDDAATHEFSFDVPMTELLVFAQGENVSINGINGQDFIPPHEIADVRYSDTPALDFANNPDVIFSRDLMGQVAWFRNIPTGSYSLDITGARTVEIYFQPDVNIGIKLFMDGQEVDNIYEGEHQVYFGFVNEEGDFFASSLLGQVTYETVVETGGRTLSVNSGDTILLDRGDLFINVRAQFLGINTAESNLSSRVFAAPTLLYVDISAPVSNISITELDDAEAFTITVRNDGNLLSESDWLNMPLPIVSSNANVSISNIRRGGTVSTFEFDIGRAAGEIGSTTAGNITFNVEAQLIYDEHLREGTGSTSMYIYIPDVEIRATLTDPNHEVTVTYLHNAQAYVLTIRQNGNLLTENEWLNMPLPTITSDADVNITGLRHGQEVSTFEFYLEQYNNDRFATSTGNIPLNIHAIVAIDGLQYAGYESVAVTIIDDISFIDRVINWLEEHGLALLILILIILFILGYTPWFKKYLSRRLKVRPEIRGTNLCLGPTPPRASGEYSKEMLYSILPYMAERGTIRFVPRGVPGVAKLAIRGGGKNTIKIMNTRSYEGRDHIRFDGIAVQKDKRGPLVKSPGVIITATVNDIKYTCNPTI
ncbi:MAG: hypothetical protein FWC77_04455 [Defluviitaleaceae bacterium]|nr:hypothetical protein [Defluviitaleaceae bacterium]